MTVSFQLLAAHPALDFVNTLDNRFVPAKRCDALRAYADLLAFLEQSNLLNARQVGGLRKLSDTAAAGKALLRAHDLRERLACVFYAIVEKTTPPPEAWASLQRYFLEANLHRVLSWKQVGTTANPITQVRWGWAQSEANLELAVWSIAQSAADLLTSAAANHLLQCASHTCRWLLLDTSKNHSRRWCDMAICGNRMKARRFHARPKAQ